VPRLKLTLVCGGIVASSRLTTQGINREETDPYAERSSQVDTLVEMSGIGLSSQSPGTASLQMKANGKGGDMATGH